VSGDDRRPNGPPPAGGGEPLIPLRPFGKTEEKVSALGLGGHHLGDAASVEEAIRIVHAAIDGGITFDKVTFGYNRQQQVLKDVDLEIKPGEMIGVVGRSGRARAPSST